MSAFSLHGLRPAALARLRALRHAGRRWRLWGVLLLVVGVMLAVLVWLARNHEIDEVQRVLDRDNADAAQVLRQGLARRLQDLHGLASTSTSAEDWTPAALALLDRHRDWLRLEWRDAALRPLAAIDSPYYPAFLGDDSASHAMPEQEVAETCAAARKLGGAAYADSRFARRAGGVGEEVMELCMPQVVAGEVTGYTYSMETAAPAACSTPCWRPPTRSARAWPSPSWTARAWPCTAARGAARGCSCRSTCSTCRATPWCCAWRAAARRPTCCPT